MRAMRSGVVVIGLVALVAVGGCGDDESEPGSGGGEGARLDAQVTYTRGGGIAGRADRLVVQPDGSATLETRKGGVRRLTLNGDEVGEIASELRRANLPSLPPTSQADPPAPRRVRSPGRLSR